MFLSEKLTHPNTVNSPPPKDGQKCYSKSDRVYVLKSIFGHIFFNGIFQYIWLPMGLKSKKNRRVFGFYVFFMTFSHFFGLNIIYSLFLLKLIFGHIFGLVFGRSVL